MSRYFAVLSVLAAAVVYGFQAPAYYNSNKSFSTVLLSESGGTNRDREIENRDTKSDDFLSKIPNPFRELSEMLQNFDDVLDDFLYKRMGNGEGTQHSLPRLRFETSEVSYSYFWCKCFPC